jgi:hypothetical protein
MNSETLFSMALGLQMHWQVKDVTLPHARNTAIDFVRSHLSQFQRLFVEWIRVWLSPEAAGKPQLMSLLSVMRP